MGDMLAHFKAEYAIPEGEKVTYSGRLDPLASGEVIMLTGNDVHKKDDYNGLDKIYNFKILFGIATDTGDVLGILKRRSILSKIFHSRLIPLNEKRIKKAILKFRKSYNQKYPNFSSFNIEGVPMWQHARNGTLPQKLPKHIITIYEINILNIYKESVENILKNVTERVGNMHGDFRQIQSQEVWQQYFKKHKNKSFFIAECQATVSSGTYIRVLAEDIGSYLCVPALAYFINREEILN